MQITVPVQGGKTIEVKGELRTYTVDGVKIDFVYDYANMVLYHHASGRVVLPASAIEARKNEFFRGIKRIALPDDQFINEAFYMLADKVGQSNMVARLSAMEVIN